MRTFSGIRRYALEFRLKYLEKHTPVSVETIAEDPAWQPYLFYKESLAVNKGG